MLQARAAPAAPWVRVIASARMSGTSNTGCGPSKRLGLTPLSPARVRQEPVVRPAALPKLEAFHYGKPCPRVCAAVANPPSPCPLAADAVAG